MANNKVDPKYRKLIEQIKIEEENMMDEEMKPLYKEQKKSLDDIEVIIGALFIKYAIDGLLKMNNAQKSDVGVKETLTTMGKKLGNLEIDKVTDILKKAYVETYYKNAYTMDIGIKIDLKFNILKKEYIASAVNTEFKGKMFSDRIWSNKADMIDKLQSSLIKCMQGETTIDKIAKDVKNTFNVQAYESKRLVNTENARVQAQAIDDVGINTNVTQQLFSATLDNKTNEEDASYDGNIYDINDDSKPIIPLHPNCRCCYINIPYEGWSSTQRKDNITKELIPNVSYSQWKTDRGVEEE